MSLYSYILGLRYMCCDAVYSDIGVQILQGKFLLLTATLMMEVAI
jgi:hypothetical protein